MAHDSGGSRQTDAGWAFRTRVVESRDMMSKLLRADPNPVLRDLFYLPLCRQLGGKECSVGDILAAITSCLKDYQEASKDANAPTCFAIMGMMRRIAISFICKHSVAKRVGRFFEVIASSAKEGASKHISGRAGKAPSEPKKQQAAERQQLPKKRLSAKEQRRQFYLSTHSASA